LRLLLCKVHSIDAADAFTWAMHSLSMISDGRPRLVGGPSGIERLGDGSLVDAAIGRRFNQIQSGSIRFKRARVLL